MSLLRIFEVARFSGQKEVISGTAFVNKAKIGIKVDNMVVGVFFALLLYDGVVMFFIGIAP